LTLRVAESIVCEEFLWRGRGNEELFVCRFKEPLGCRPVSSEMPGVMCDGGLLDGIPVNGLIGVIFSLVKSLFSSGYVVDAAVIILKNDP